MVDIADFLALTHTYDPRTAKAGENATTTGREHPETSHAAAARALGKTGTTRRAVLAAICAQPSTDEELQDILDMPPNTERPRRRELVRDGFVVKSDQERLTVTGARAIVWEATPLGRQANAL